MSGPRNQCTQPEGAESLHLLPPTATVVYASPTPQRFGPVSSRTVPLDEELDALGRDAVYELWRQSEFRPRHRSSAGEAIWDVLHDSSGPSEQITQPLWWNISLQALR